MTVCPACGYELLPHPARITCKRCGSRIPADSVKCPRCNNDPRAERIPPIVMRLMALFAGIVFLICIGWIVFRVVTTNVAVQFLGLNQPTRVPTRVIQVIYVVASPAPPTSTSVPSPTPTKPISPTPTRRGAPAATSIPKPTSIPPGFYPAIALNAPANTAVYGGANAVIVMEWLSVAPNGLKENEWHEIKLNFTGRDNQPTERKSYTKETRWIVSPDLYREISPTARTFNWTLNIVRVDGFDPLASLNRAVITVSSSTRTFIWNP